jgi:signal transduction histidine kinase
MHTANGTVRVEVSDRGPGIPDNFRDRMFMRFAQADSTVTRQKGGTGLGLAISKRLVEMMDGHIGFEDRDGGGSTFYFELPLRQPALAAKM